MNARIRAGFPVTQDLIRVDTAYEGPFPLAIVGAGL